MSTTIDQRVVEMQFDNRHFEQNVKTSISTLDKLKQSLNLTGAAKGFDNVSAAAKKVDMNGLSNGVETVRQRFSALEVMGVTALANITNSAVNAGKRMLAALTIDPIKTGFNEYETKINAIQTIWSNTQSKGTTMDQITTTLNELNTYADKTIYNFAEMTRNIGTFTAAGIGLEESATAIQGIANLAAASGSNAQQASTAMYQLSQALASGTVKLMDWNSVVNAGMGGELFQNALKDTARAHGVAVDEMIKKAGSFRESLKDGWITSEILTETLGKMTKSGAAEYLSKVTGVELDQITAAQKLADETGDSATAYEKLVETMASSGKISKDEALNILKLADNAESAATKVKTFTQLWDTLKESAQSGWAQTWEIIVGDFDEARDLLTSISDTIGGFIGKMSDWRNNLLRGALDLGTPWASIKEKLENSGLSKVMEGVEKVSETVNKAKHSLEEFQGIVDKVWRGDYGNHNTEDESIDRFSRLDKEGWDHRVVQDLVNKGYGYKITMEDVEASHKKFGLTMEQTTESTKKTSTAIAELSDEQLKNAGLTDEEIKLYRDLEAEAKRTGTTIEELAEKMSKKDGRTLLIESFKNAGQGLVAVLGAIKDAWLEIFPPMSVVQLYGIIDGINQFSQHLKVSDETADNLKRTLKGVFAVVDILATIFGGSLRIAFKILSSILGFFNLDILEFTALIGDALVKVRDWFDGLFDVSGVLEVIVPWIANCAKAIGEWFASLKETKLFKTVSGYLSNMATSIKEWFASFDAGAAFKSFVDWLAKGYNNLANWINELRASDSILGKIVRIIDKLTQSIRDWFSSLDAGTIFTDFNGFLQNGIQNIKDWFNTLYESEGIAGDIIRGLVNGLGSGLSTVWEAAVELADNIVTAVCDFLGIESPSKKFIEIGEYVIEGLIEGIRYGVGKIMDVFSAIIEPVIEWIKSLDLGTIFSIAFGAGTLWFLKQVGDLVGGLGSFLDGLSDITKSVKKVGKALSTALYAEAAKGFATAILILAGAIVVLTLLPVGKMWSAVGAIVLIISVLAGALVAMNLTMKENSLGSVAKFAGLVLAVAGAVMVMAFAVTLLNGIAWGDGMAKFGAILLAFSVVVGLLLLVSSKISVTALSSFAAICESLVQVALAIGILVIALKVIADIPSDSVWQAYGVLAAIGGLMVAMVALMQVISMIPGGSITTAGTTLLSIGGAFILLALTLHILSKLDKDSIDKSLNVLTSLGEIIVRLIAVITIASWLTGGMVAQFGTTMLGIGGAFLMLAITMHILAALDKDAFARSMDAIWALTGVIAALLVVVKLLGPREAVKMGGTLLALAGSIAILAAIAVILGMIDQEGLNRGIEAVAKLAIIMAALIFVTKFAQNCTGTLWALVGAIAIMATAIGVLTICDPDKIKQTTAAMIAMMVSFAIMMKATKNVSGSISTLITLTVAIGLMAGVLILMSELDVKNALPNAAALSLVMLAMGGVLAIISAIGQKAKNALTGILALTAMVVPLVAFAGSLWLIEKMKISDSIASTIGIIAAVIGAMTLLLIPLAAIGTLAGFQSLIGVLALTAMAVALVGFAGALWLVERMNISPSMVGTVMLLTQLMTAMTLLLVPLSLIGVLCGVTGGMALLGILALTLMAVPLLAFAGSIWLIGKMNIGNALPIIMMLVTILDALTDMLVKVSLIAPLALVGVAAITAMTGVIAVFGIIAGAIGGLVELVPQIGDFINTGIPILVSLAEGLGQAIGAFVGGIFSESFAGVGDAIVSFVEDISTAMDKLSGVDTSKTEAIKSLAGALLAITGAELIDQLNNFIFGTTAEESFSGKMVALAQGLAAFGEAAKDIDVESIQPAVDAIGILANANIPDASWYEKLIPWAKNDEGVFGQGLEQLSAGMKAIASAVNDNENPIDQEKLKQFVAGVELLSNANIPDATWYEKIVPWAKNDEGVFGNGIATLASGMAAVAKATNDETNIIDPEKFQTFVSALEMLSNAYIPDASWYEKIIPWAESDESVFANGLKSLGEGLAAFYESIADKNFQASKMDSISGALSSIIKMVNSGSVSAETGNNWKTMLTNLGAGLHSFYTEAQKIVADNLTASIDSVFTSVKKVTDMIKSSDISGTHSNIALLTDALKNLLSLDASSSTVVDAINSITKINLESLSSACSSIVESMGTIAEDMIASFVSGVEANISTATDACTAMAEDCAAAISEVDFSGAGGDVVTGFASGITANTWQAEAKARAMANAAEKAAKDALDINSPSKVFRAIGYSVPEGFAQGIDRMSRLVTGSSKSMAQASIDSVKGSIARLADVVSADIDTQPTIRPVLDLSDVRTGANAIDGLLNSGSALGVTANVNSINSMMNRRIQNGVSNGDVVSAIEKLNKSLGNVGNTTYAIDGITYDDGTNISNAVKDLVRAARIERRV